MREIGSIGDEARALRFVDTLAALDIPAEARPDPVGGWGVWVHREEHVARGRDALGRFLEAPDDPRYLEAQKVARTKRKAAAEADRSYRRRTVDLSGRLNVISPARCPVTHALILASIAVSLWTSLGRDTVAMAPLYLTPPNIVAIELPDGRRLTTLDPRSPSAGLAPLRAGQVWRLFTPMFLHYGLPHLLFNMMALYGLGGMIELRRSSRLLLLLVLCAAPVSFLGQYAWDVHRLGPDTLSMPGGMSGVVYALFGFVWMKSDYEPESGLTIAGSTIQWMLGWLVVCMTGLLGPIANAAHVAGLLLGLLVGLAGPLWDSRPWR